MALHRISRVLERQIRWRPFGRRAQMLDFFGYENYGKLVIDAIEDVLVEKKHLSPELGGNAKTNEVGDAVQEKVAARMQHR